MSWLNGRLEAQVGDITTLAVDAIANAANTSLLGGGGVDGAIHRAGGSDILRECQKIRQEHYPDGLPTGEAVTTGAGKLPCRYVIHAVGPVWQGGENDEPALLAAAYRHILDKATECGARSLAIPAISTGVYGYPPEEAAKIAWKVLSARIPKRRDPHRVILVFYSQQNLQIFLNSVPIHP
ncbi:MAG: O-acetyl-ADP-ribose deacetylase [Spirochaetales bacterium]|nr:O-acetyl-ADP-ribose deacetylase [Spirochaetales bacterium]